jgi:hypothetical protein
LAPRAEGAAERTVESPDRQRGGTSPDRGPAPQQRSRHLFLLWTSSRGSADFSNTEVCESLSTSPGKPDRFVTPAASSRRIDPTFPVSRETACQDTRTRASCQVRSRTDHPGNPPPMAELHTEAPSQGEPPSRSRFAAGRSSYLRYRPHNDVKRNRRFQCERVASPRRGQPRPPASRLGANRAHRSPSASEPRSFLKRELRARSAQLVSGMTIDHKRVTGFLAVPDLGATTHRSSATRAMPAAHPRTLVLPKTIRWDRCVAPAKAPAPRARQRPER